MASSKEPAWFKHLKYDKDLEAYCCNHKFVGGEIGINLFCDKVPEHRRAIADAAEQLLVHWPKQAEKIVKEIRNELIEQERVSQRDRTKITSELLSPFSLTVFHDTDGESHYSWGINLPGVLEEDEYIDFAGDLANTWTTVELACTE